MLCVYINYIIYTIINNTYIAFYIIYVYMYIYVCMYE